MLIPASRNLMLILLILLTIQAFTKSAYAVVTEDSSQEKGIYVVPRASSAIRVDGSLDEAAWESALVLELKYETYSGHNTEAPARTECLILYDDNYFYVGFRAYDPDTSAIRARLTDRDNFYDNDSVGVVLDTFNDQRRAFEFLCNPLGVQGDYLYDDLTGNEDPSWDAIWDSAGRITEFGYVVEIAIPFNQLRFQRSDGSQVWGFGAFRIYPRNIMMSMATHKWDRDIDSFLNQIDKIEGFEGVTPGKNIEIVPTVTAVRTDARSPFPGGQMEELESKGDIGLSARWGMTPNLILNGTINPDFSQIEADALQLDINERFALHYPEKRPFFLEGADFFDTPISAVYTRTIADPVWGAKFSGKEGGNAFGIYLARDGITNLVFPGSEGSESAFLDQENTAAVFRYRRDVGANSALGVLSTFREGADYYNRVYGVDGLYRFSDADTLSFQVLGSSTKYPLAISGNYFQPKEEFGDKAIFMRYSRVTRDWFLRVRYQDYGRDFRSDLGFRTQVGIRELDITGRRRWWFKPGSFLTFMSLSNVFEQTEEQSGSLIEREFRTVWMAEGPMQSRIELGAGRRRQVFTGIHFVQNFQNAEFNFQPFKNALFTMVIRLEDWIDFLHSREAKQFAFFPYLNIHLRRDLQLVLEHSLKRLNVAGGRLFLANASEMHLIYHLNRKTFIRAILQYEDIRRNTDLYAFEVDPESKSLFTQFLFSYKLNPQTVLFIGYSDNHFGGREYGLTQADRTLFVKIGYAWVL